METSNNGLRLPLGRVGRLFSPVPVPMPIRAVPASCIIVFTSKSRLIMAWTVITFAIPCTPWRKTSSIILNDSTKVVFYLRFAKFGRWIVIITSTLRASCSLCFLGYISSLRSFKTKRFITTATLTRRPLLLLPLPPARLRIRFPHLNRR